MFLTMICKKKPRKHYDKILVKKSKIMLDKWHLSVYNNPRR